MIFNMVFLFPLFPNYLPESKHITFFKSYVTILPSVLHEETLYFCYYIKQSSTGNMADLMAFYHFSCFLQWQQFIVVYCSAEEQKFWIHRVQTLSPVLASCVAMKVA